MRYELEETAGYLIYRVGRLLRYRAGQFFRDRDIGISPEQWVLLLQIAEKGRSAMSDLVDKTANDHPNVTRLVRGLEKIELVHREPNPDDKRSQLISLTQAGQTLIDDNLYDLIDEKSAFFDGLDQADVTALVRTLKVVLGNLEK